MALQQTPSPFSGCGFDYDFQFGPGGDVVFDGGCKEIVLGLPVQSLSLIISLPVAANNPRSDSSVRLAAAAISSVRYCGQ